MLAIACRGPAPSDAPRGEPLVVGPVESLAGGVPATGVLVRAAPGSREMCGISARLDDGTRYFRRDHGGALRAAALADLGVGDTVEVYVDGPVAESCPVQGRAAAIVSLRP